MHQHSLSRLALLPLNVHDLSELEISRVGGEQTGSRRRRASQADLGVDVEHAGRSAGGPDNGGRVGLIVLEVVTDDGTVELVFGGGLYITLVSVGLPICEHAYLSSLTREVVGGLEGSADALLDGSVSTVVGGENRVLEAAWVKKVDVELAVLALLGDSDAGADGGNVRIEDEGDNGAVTRDLGAHRSLRTSCSTIADTSDRNLWRVS
jgi:hypothetical protein